MTSDGRSPVTRPGRAAGARAGVAAAALAAALAGCAGTQDPGRAEVEYRGTDPAGGGGGTSGAGIVSYDGYAAARAREGDTVAALARRVGVPAADLAAYNGLAPTQSLRSGDELVLPPRAEGYAVAEAPAPAPAPTRAPAPEPEPDIEATPLDAGGTAPGLAPATIAALEGGAGTADGTATDDDGWSPELAAAAIERATGLDDEGNLRAPPSSVDPLPPEPERAPDLASPGLGQYQSPEPDDGPVPVPGTAAPDMGTEPRSRPADAPLDFSAVPEPEAETSAAGPAPAPAEPEPETADTPTEPEPDPSTPETRRAALAAAAAADSAGRPADAEGRWSRAGGLMRPVSAPIALGYGAQADGGRNQGVDFAAAAGTPVVAAADGEVALVSSALGGLGTIVLLRHPDELLTVYGRIDNVTVARGDIVARGQQIGTVAAPEPPAEARMHFEVRKGATAVDPMGYLDG